LRRDYITSIPHFRFRNFVLPSVHYFLVYSIVCLPALTVSDNFIFFFLLRSWFYYYGLQVTRRLHSRRSSFKIKSDGSTCLNSKTYSRSNTSSSIRLDTSPKPTTKHISTTTNYYQGKQPTKTIKMHSSTRTNRFRSFTPLRSSILTSFSPRSSRSISTSSTNTVSSTSPLSRNSSPHSYRSSAASIREMLSLRRKPSVLEFEMEEEQHLFEHELELLEPRPSMGYKGRMGSETHVVGIFEVLDGKC
jgi:hypothetical protein